MPRQLDAETPDEALMLRYAAGDATAFDVLYTRHRGGVFRYLLRHGSGNASEELAHDVWASLIRVRAQYQATEQWLWNVGVAYDSSAVSDSNRSVVVPMNESWRIATGATYALNENTDVNVSWAMVWLGDMPVDQAKSVSGNRISGQFDNAWIQAINGNMTWRF